MGGSGLVHARGATAGWRWRRIGGCVARLAVGHTAHLLAERSVVAPLVGGVPRSRAGIACAPEQQQRWGARSCAARHRRSAPLRPPRGDCEHPVPSSRWPHRMAARGTRVRLRQQRRQGWGRGRARRWPAGSALRAPGAPAQGGRLHSDLSRSFWSRSWACSSRFIHVSPDRCTRPLSGRRRAAAGGRHARQRHPPMAHGRPAAARRPPCSLLTTSDALSSSPHATRPSTDARMVANRGTGRALRAAGLRAARPRRERSGPHWIRWLLVPHRQAPARAPPTPGPPDRCGMYQAASYAGHRRALDGL